MRTSVDIQSKSIIIHDGVIFDKEKMTDREVKRLELEIEVSQFKKQGNKIKSLPQGHTEYPDGILPVSHKPKAHSTTSPAAPQKTPHNVEASKLKPATRKVEPSKPKSPKPEVKRLAPEELERRKAVKKAHREAALKGLTEFQATCNSHGLTTFVIYTDTCRCQKCLRAKQKRQNQKNQVKDPEAAKLKKIAAERRAEAVANGLTEFLGICKIHQETLYKIQSNGSRCHACCLERSRKDRNAKRSAELIIDNERKRKNKPLIQQAIADGVNEFQAYCRTCNLTTFRLRVSSKASGSEKKYAFCVECTRKLHRIDSKKKAP